jgi:hypothetical protein
LRVIVLGGAGDQSEVFLFDLMGIDEAELAQLPDREAAGIPRWHHHPPLRGVVLCGAGDETEIVV